MRENIQLFIQDMGISSFNDIKSLYADYLEETSTIIGQLTTSFVPLSCLEMEKLVHNLKGVSANLYVNGVYSDALLLDNYLKIHSNEPNLNASARLLLNNLLDTYTQESGEIKAYFKF